MKVDGNYQETRSVYVEYDRQSSAASVQQTAGSQGASFERNRNEMFVEQLERIEGGRPEDLDPKQDTRSKLEVLASLVTERDLQEFKKHSEELEEEELDVIVTVMEKIRIQLAAYCDDFDSGMVEDLSDDKIASLSHLTGNAVHIARKLQENNLPVTEETVEGMLAAYDQLANMGPLTQEAKEYCMKADAELTIENLYQAQHSGACETVSGYYTDAGGYYTKAGGGETAAQLLPQLERVVSEAGLAGDEQALKQAEWLLNRQLPVTKENLWKLRRMDEISGLLDSMDEPQTQEEVLAHMMDALIEGRRPSQADLGETPVRTRSEQLVAVLQNAKDEHLQAVVAAEEEVTPAALARAEQGVYGTAYLEETDIALVTARRQLEEIRLQMTVESCAVMIRNGITVETESLQNMLDRLQELEQQYYKDLFEANHMECSDADIRLYQEIQAVTEHIGNAPADVIGITAFSQTEMTLREVHTEGQMLEERYRQANQAYETVMTRPRSDMGDSIQKAFRNVDAILKELGLEVNYANQRAVRILGYNSIEITMENIEKVKAADLEVTEMIESMKPGAVLKMIREGYNPLDRTAAQINEKLMQFREEHGQGNERFSEFLWNLEHSKNISGEEREAYIGIYRLLHQIERSDGAVIGAMLEQGAELTMRNLMTGIRSRKHGAMDYKIGEIDGVEGSRSAGITEQIENGFHYIAQLSARTQRQMAAADYSQFSGQEELMDLSLEAFEEYVQEQQQEGRAQADYAAEQRELLIQAGQTEETILNQLSAYGQPLTMTNMYAATQLFKGRSHMFQSLREDVQRPDAEEHQFEYEVQQFADAFTDKEAAQGAYNRLMQTVASAVDQEIQQQDTYAAMRGWKLLSSQVHLAASLSGSEDYHIPVDINGRLTAVHVQFIHHEDRRSQVAVSLDTGAAGRIAVQFTEKEGSLEGYIITESRQAREGFLAGEGQLRQQIEQACGLPVGKMDYALHEGLELAQCSEAFAKQASPGSVSGSGLYQVAKAVLGFVKSMD